MSAAENEHPTDPDELTPVDCPVLGGCKPVADLKQLVELLGTHEAEHHQAIMRRLDGFSEWQDSTQVRMQRAKAFEEALESRVDVAVEKIERMARNAGAHAGSESGALAARASGRRAALPYSAAALVLSALITTLGAMYVSHHSAQAAPMAPAPSAHR